MSENMVDKMKRKLSAKSATAILIFGAIILVFVFFGLPTEMGGGVGSVARVNNSLISIADFQQEENRIQQYYQNLFGGAMDLGSQRQLLRQQALENLVRMELVYQAAQSEGILATDAEVRDFIVKDIPFFQENGQFQREFYRRYLETTRSTPGDFESKVRKDIANIRTRRLFEMVSAPTQVETQKLKDLRGYKVNIQFVKLDQDALNKAMTPEKAEEALKNLDEALAAGDESAVDAQLKAMGGKWEETGLVELASEQFPKITSAVANDAAFELTSAQPLLKRLVRDGQSKYVLKLKQTKAEEVATLEPMAAEMIEKRRGSGLFEAWINQFRQNSHVTMNAEFMQLK